MKVEVQLRGRKKPLVFETIDEAFEEARRNDDVWRIKWMEPNGEKICFQWLARTRSTVIWKYLPQTIIET